MTLALRVDDLFIFIPTPNLPCMIGWILLTLFVVISLIYVFWYWNLKARALKKTHHPECAGFRPVDRVLSGGKEKSYRPGSRWCCRYHHEKE